MRTVSELDLVRTMSELDLVHTVLKLDLVRTVLELDLVRTVSQRRATSGRTSKPNSDQAMRTTSNVPRQRAELGSRSSFGCS